MDTG
ncbi:hypothetical protein F383_24504 [Gossypium arboreum]|jgi:hypothetical protein